MRWLHSSERSYISRARTQDIPDDDSRPNQEIKKPGLLIPSQSRHAIAALPLLFEKLRRPRSRVRASRAAMLQSGAIWPVNLGLSRAAMLSQAVLPNRPIFRS